MFQTASRPHALIRSRPLVVTALAVGFALIFATALLNAYSTREAYLAKRFNIYKPHAPGPRALSVAQFAVAISS